MPTQATDHVPTTCRPRADHMAITCRSLVRRRCRCLPFGSVVAVRGACIRATVACSAGLAVELPLWGVHLKGDQSWLIRALKPVETVVLRVEPRGF